MVGMMVSSLAGEKEYSKAVLMVDQSVLIKVSRLVDYLVVPTAF